MAARLDTVLAALADPTRRRLLDRMSREGPLTPTELAQAMPVTRQAVTKHLFALKEAGLVSSERHGREVQYTVVTSNLRQASTWLSEVGDLWDERLAALARTLRKQ